MMSNRTANYVRDKDDFFETPVECTVAFMKAESSRMPIDFWEPACGEGAICKQMPGRNWIATDLVNRGFGQRGIDFLMERSKLADAIITNPPFKLLKEFINKAIDLDVGYIAMFFQTAFLNSGAWHKIYDRRPPARIYVLTWRPDIFNIGTPDQRCCFSWVVWDNRFDRYENETIYRPLRKPK